MYSSIVIEIGHAPASFLRSSSKKHKSNTLLSPNRNEKWSIHSSLNLFEWRINGRNWSIDEIPRQRRSRWTKFFAIFSHFYVSLLWLLEKFNSFRLTKWDKSIFESGENKLSKIPKKKTESASNFWGQWKESDSSVLSPLQRQQSNMNLCVLSAYFDNYQCFDRALTHTSVRSFIHC